MQQGCLTLLRIFYILGSVEISKILFAFGQTRQISNSQERFLLQKIWKDYMNFIVGGEYSFTPELYKMAARKWLSWKLQVTYEMVSVTRNSVFYQQKLNDVDTGLCLGTFTAKSVFVDRKTRRANGLPSWLMEHELYNAAPHLNLRFSGESVIPNDAFQYSYTIMPSDTDFNQHTNNVTYLRVCLDTADLACRKAIFAKFKDSIYRYDAKTIKVHFAKETTILDKLDIVVWEGSKDDLILHSVIFRGKRAVYYQDTVFYSRYENDKLVSKY